MSALLVQDLHKSYGGIVALDGAQFAIDGPGIYGLIGPNGAGKTTLFDAIAGTVVPDSGRVVLGGRDVTGWSSHRMAAAGISRTFQIVQPFPQMTVLENVSAAVLFASGAAQKISQAQEIAFEHLKFVGLEALANRSAQTLTLPSRKRLELAKSLAMNPRLLMLDEVNAGLNTGEVEQALDLIRAIAARGITILIIEHLMKVVLTLSHRIMVLHHGELISEGTAKEVVNDPKVIEAYLGSKFSEKQTFVEDSLHG